MRWTGKIVGLLVGYLAAGPFGAALGGVVGHVFDRGLTLAHPSADLAAQVQDTFFRTTFLVMGQVCKSDGRVTQAEIRAAERAMAQMALSAEQRRRAIEYFEQGKRPGFELDPALDEFRALCQWQPNLYRFFLEVQLQAALADGHVDENKRQLLLHIAKRLGLSRQDYLRLESLLKGGRQQRAASPSSRGSLESSYSLLGVPPDAADGDIKRAYRRLMSQHHPDKLVAKGLPKEMMDLAKQKTQEIRAAYELIREARGIR